MKTKNIFSAIIILTAFFLLSTTANAGIPHLINYQGKLTKTDGTAYAVGEYKISISIYDHATGGSLVWGPQVFNNTPLVYGHFNIILGPTDTTSRDIVSAFASENAYLEIKVNNDPPITPRQKILSAPYAVKAENAVTAGTASTVVNSAITGSKIAGNAVTSSKINDGTITSADIANGAITGTDIANNSIGPEKLNFGLAPADYDSGWFQALKNHNYDESHNLGTLPRLAIVWGASDSSGSHMHLIDDIHSSHPGGGFGSWLQRITTTSYRISTGAHSAMTGDGIDLHWTWDNGDGYIRVFMWK